MVYLLVNPAANNGKADIAQAMISGVLEQRGIKHSVHRSEGPGDAAAVCRRAREEQAEAVFLLAGDGTIGECAEVLQGGEVPLGLLPGGTGNDFARALGLPLKLSGALETLLAGQKKRVDILRWTSADGQSGIIANALGCGIDVEVLRRREKVRGLGKLSYIWALLGTALHYTGERMQGIWEEKSFDEKTLLLFAANGQSIGGGIKLAPRSKPDDGLMDIVYVEGLKKLRMWQLLAGVPNGSFLDAPEVRYAQVKEWRLPGKYLCEMDGEIREMQDLLIEILPGALPVLL